MIINLYRKFIPESFRYFVYNLFLGKLLREIRDYERKRVCNRLAIEIPAYYLANSTKYSEEYLLAANWIKENGFSVFPDDFIFEYRNKKIIILVCEQSGLKYTLHNQKRLYFPRCFSKKECLAYYLELLLEQDTLSPHRYNYLPFEDNRCMSLFDIGAAEGIFTLSVIDMVERAYLFECDELWLEALQWTFKPYMNKVEIVNKYISNKDEGSEISVDTFMKGKKYTDCYIKLDIEGAESKALIGANDFLQSDHRIFISACAYHLDKAGDEIHNILKKKEFTCTYTSGVMAFGIEPPYFRKGVIYARNN